MENEGKRNGVDEEELEWMEKDKNGRGKRRITEDWKLERFEGEGEGQRRGYMKL